MYQILKQTVFSFLIIGVFVSQGSAKDIPITNSVTIYIPVQQFSVVEFPFKITGKKASSFYTVVKVEKKKKNKDSIINIPSMDKPLISSSHSKKTKKVKKSKAPIKIAIGENNLQLYPLTKGHLEFVIWGYKKYPILLKIVVDPALGENYYKFIDYSTKPKAVKSFESDTHEKIISKLTKALFKRKAPKGYKKESFYSKFTSENTEFVLVQSFFGKRYIGEEWVATNNSSKREKLYPEEFFNDDIYSVSFENDILLPKESTRIFIVRKYSNTNEYKR